MSTEAEEIVTIELDRVVELTHILIDLFQEYSGAEIGSAIVAALAKNEAD